MTEMFAVSGMAVKTFENLSGARILMAVGLDKSNAVGNEESS